MNDFYNVNYLNRTTVDTNGCEDIKLAYDTVTAPDSTLDVKALYIQYAQEHPSKRFILDAEVVHTDK